MLLKKIKLLLLGLIFLSACSASKETRPLPYYNDASFTPLFLTKDNRLNETISHKADLKNYSFLTQDSTVYVQKNVNDKIVVSSFIFTKCGSICPIMTQHLSSVVKAFKDDEGIEFLSFTVTPWKDRCADLKKYKTENGWDNYKQWQFLTGKKNEIYEVARKEFFAEESLGYTKDSTEFLHTEHIILADKNGYIRGIYNGTLQLEMEQLKSDLILLNQE